MNKVCAFGHDTLVDGLLKDGLDYGMFIMIVAWAAAQNCVQRSMLLQGRTRYCGLYKGHLMKQTFLPGYEFGLISS